MCAPLNHNLPQSLQIYHVTTRVIIALLDQCLLRSKTLLVLLNVFLNIGLKNRVMLT